jgi:hypothetical protein
MNRLAKSATARKYSSAVSAALSVLVAAAVNTHA